MSWDQQPPVRLPQLPQDILDWIKDLAGRPTYPDSPARQELLERLNMRWRDHEPPPARATYY